MQTRILSRLIAHPAFALIVEDKIASSNFHPCSDAVSIRLCSNQQDLQPVIFVATIVTQQLRSLSAIVDEDVQVAVVVEVSDSCSPAHPRQLKIRAKLIANILENAAA